MLILDEASLSMVETSGSMWFALTSTINTSGTRISFWKSEDRRDTDVGGDNYD